MLSGLGLKVFFFFGSGLNEPNYKCEHTLCYMLCALYVFFINIYLYVLLIFIVL